MEVNPDLVGVLLYQACQLVGIEVVPLSAAEDLFTFCIEQIRDRDGSNVTELFIHKITAHDRMHAGMCTPHHPAQAGIGRPGAFIPIDGNDIELLVAPVA